MKISRRRRSAFRLSPYAQTPAQYQSLRALDRLDRWGALAEDGRWGRGPTVADAVADCLSRPVPEKQVFTIDNLVADWATSERTP